MLKPRIFIGSSKESLVVAKHLQNALSDWAFAEIWTQGFFDNTTSIECLVQNLPNFDCCVLLITPDDKSRSRSKEYYVPRDNVIFELGLAFGFIGRNKTFMVQPNNVQIKLPSDLLGTNSIRYDPTAPNMLAELSVVSNKVQQYWEMITPQNFNYKQLRKIESHINPHFNYEFTKILDSVFNSLIDKCIIRKNWVIDLSFADEISTKSSIKEKMVFEFELLNISDKPVDYNISILQLTEDVNHLYSVSKVTNSCKQIIFSSHDFKTNYSFNGIMMRSTAIQLDPGVFYYIHVDFESIQNVSTIKPFIHNAFAPREFTIPLTVNVTFPLNFEFHISGLEGFEPVKTRKLDGYMHHYYKIPGMLLPGQIIEYTLKKEEKNGKT